MTCDVARVIETLKLLTMRGERAYLEIDGLGYQDEQIERWSIRDVALSSCNYGRNDYQSSSPIQFHVEIIYSKAVHYRPA